MNTLQRLLFAFACAALLLSAMREARAQSIHTLEGKAVLQNGEPPPNPVNITLTLSGRLIYETFTDLGGHFTFGALSKGRYQLTARGDGQTFETTSVYADVSAFGSAPQTFTQNVLLIPRRADPSQSPPAGVVAVEELDADTPDGAREKYRKALKSAAESKTEQAAKLLEEAVREHPTFYAANLALGEQYSKLQRYEEAVAAYRKASELKPERAEPYVGIGVALVNQKRYDEGIALLRRIVELDEKLAAPYLSLGYAEMMKGDYRAAEKHLLRAYELSKPAIAHVYLANVYEQLNEPAKAVEHLQAYLKENPQSQNTAAVRGAIEKLHKKIKDKK